MPTATTCMAAHPPSTIHLALPRRVRHHFTKSVDESCLPMTAAMHCQSQQMLAAMQRQSHKLLSSSINVCEANSPPRRLPRHPAKCLICAKRCMASCNHARMRVRWTGNTTHCRMHALHDLSPAFKRVCISSRPAKPVSNGRTRWLH
jgi:hypothetical protein